MRISGARIPAIAESAAICAALTFTSIGVQPFEPNLQHLRTEVASVHLQVSDTVLTDLANAAIAVVGAAAWFAAFPITLPASVGVVLWADAFRNAGFPTLRLDQLLGSGLQLFVSLPTYAVQNAFTKLGESLGVITPPATPAAARTAAAIATPIEIGNRAADVVRTVTQAAIWFAAFPLTLAKSLFVGMWAAVYASGINNWAVQIPLIDALGIGLTSFFETPLKPVQDAFTALGSALGFMTAPAAAARTPAGAARTETVKTARAAVTTRSSKKPASAAAHRGAKNAKRSAAHSRQATPR